MKTIKNAKSKSYILKKKKYKYIILISIGICIFDKCKFITKEN